MIQWGVASSLVIRGRAGNEFILRSISQMDTLDSSVVDTGVSNVNPFAGYNSHCEVANMVTSCVAYNCTNRQETGSGIYHRPVMK